MLRRDVPLRCRGLESTELHLLMPVQFDVARSVHVHMHVGTKVIHIPQLLAAMGPQGIWPYAVGAFAPLPPYSTPVDVQAVPRRIAPGKYNMQDGVELGEGRRPTDQMAERVRHRLHLPPK